MNRAILAIPVVDISRFKLFLANYKALRKHYGILKSLDIASIHTKDSRLVIDASVEVDYSLKGDSTSTGVFSVENASVTLTAELTSPELEKFMLWLDEIDHGDGGENG